MSARRLAQVWEARVGVVDGERVDVGGVSSDSSFSSTSSAGDNSPTSPHRIPRRVSANKPPRPPPRLPAANIVIVDDPDDVDSAASSHKQDSNPDSDLHRLHSGNQREIERLQELLAKMDDEVRMLEETVRRQARTVREL